jgi:hypothetical protein
MIDDFIITQDIRYSQRIIVNNDVSSAEDRDNFLLNLSKDYYNMCFVFPKIDDTYYSYQPNNAVESYVKFTTDVNDIETIWDDSYDQFYEYDSETKTYNKLEKYQSIS